jgi:hypothetical protein
MRPAGSDHIVHARDAWLGGQWDVQGEVRGQQVIGGILGTLSIMILLTNDCQML